MRFIEKDPSSLDFIAIDALLQNLPGTEYNDKKKKVFQYLSKTYNERCGFCGVSVGKEWVGEIEHFYCKAKYKHLCKDLRNLHLACKRCNSIKGKKDVLSKKIWTPNFYNTNPTSKSGAYLTWSKVSSQDHKNSFHYKTYLLDYKQNSGTSLNAKETVSFFDLNGVKTRKYLKELRIRKYNEALTLIAHATEIITFLERNPTTTSKPILIKTLVLLCNSIESLASANADFSEMIQDNFSGSITYIQACTVKLS